MTRYTINLDPDAYRVFDELMLAARRHLGGRVDKSEIIRAFLLLAADDLSLRQQVIREISGAPHQGDTVTNDEQTARREIADATSSLNAASTGQQTNWSAAAAAYRRRAAGWRAYQADFVGDALTGQAMLLAAQQDDASAELADQQQT
jgi:hypothetical protein